MDRVQFLKNLRASKVPLHPLQIEGWEGVVYLRPSTIGEIRDTMLLSEDELPIKEQLKQDPLFLARSIAKLVRDESGALLFDANNDVQMTELMAVLADAGPNISKQVNQAYNKLNEPDAMQVTPEGNSQSAKSS